MKASVFLIGMFLSSHLFAAIDAKKILSAAETIRNPKVSYIGTIKITDQRPDIKDEIRTYRVKSRGNTESLVEYLTPATEAGTKVLLVKDDMWIALSGASKPIRVAPKNKVVGNAAYGDIVTISFEETYEPTFKKEDSFGGKKVYVLDLKAKEGKIATYERIEYWIEQSTSMPVRTFYMTSAGKVLREGIFTGHRKVLGIDRPLTLILKNSLDQKLTTKIELVTAEEKKFPNTLFQKSSLK